MQYVYAKLIFTFLFIGWCSAGPFFSLVWKNVLHLDESQIGFLSSLQPILAFICVPLWTTFADKMNWHRQVVIYGCVVMATLMNFMFFRPSYPLLVVLYCTYSASMVCVGPLTDSLVLGMLGTDSDSYGRQRVFGTLACGLTSFLTGLLVSQTGNLYYPFIIRFCAMSIVVGLLAKVPNYWRRPDQVETFALKEPPKAVTAGAALQHRPSLASTDSSMFSVFDPSLTTSPAVMSSPANPLHGSSFLGDMPGDLRKSALTKGMDRRSEIIAKTATVAETVPAKPASASPPSRKCTGPASLGWLLNINVITFLFSMLCIGLTLVVISTFEWLYLIRLGAPTQLLGMTSLAGITLEAPMFFFSKTILGKLGIPGTIMLAQSAMTVRVLSYSFLTQDTVWAVLAIELLHGICFATAWAAGVKFAGLIAPPGKAATSQGILNAVFSGLGPAVGCTVGGFLYTTYGPQFMFRVLAVLNFSGLVLFAGVLWVRARIEARNMSQGVGVGQNGYERIWEATAESLKSLVELTVDTGLPPKKPPRPSKIPTSAQSVGLFAIGSESSRLGSIGSLDSKKDDGEPVVSEKGSQKTVAVASSVSSLGSTSRLIQRAQSASLNPDSRRGSSTGIDLAVLKSPRGNPVDAIPIPGSSSVIGGQTIGAGKQSSREALP